MAHSLWTPCNHVSCFMRWDRGIFWMAQFGIYETRFDLQIFRVATVHPSNIELQRRKQRRSLFGYLK